MVDKVEVEVQGSDVVSGEVLSPATKLRTLRVVHAVFGVDPEAQKRFNKQYGYAPTRQSSSGTYHYVTDLEFQKDDFAVVETPNGLTVVTIVDVGADMLFGTAPPNYKWVISKVDYVDYRERLDRENRRKFLVDSLTSRARDIKDRLKLEEVLGTDPASQELLKELKSLQ